MTRTPPLLKNGDALFLDFDGTLVEIAQRPDLVHVPAGLRACLAGLQAALGGALAIVTGRRYSDVQDYLRPLVLPGAGQHGAELCPPGVPPPQALAAPSVQEAAAVLRTRFAGVHGVLVEDKGLSVSLHYRNAPERAAECEGVIQLLATRLGLNTLRGKQVIEARVSPVTKGDGICALMGLLEFRGRQPVFLGDDMTDEYGFKAVNALGGISVKVGSGDSKARHALTDVAAVHRWLERSLQGLSA